MGLSTAERNMADIPHLPPSIYVLNTRLDVKQRDTIIDNLKSHKFRVATSANEATIFLGDVLAAKRAGLELKSLGLETNDVTKDGVLPMTGKIVKVVKMAWYRQAVESREKVDIDDFVVYRGHYVPSNDRPTTPVPPAPTAKPANSLPITPQKRPRSPDMVDLVVSEAAERVRREGILRRAMEDNRDLRKPDKGPGSRHWGRRDHGRGHTPKPLQVSRQDTDEHDEDEAAASNMPDQPDWVKNQEPYACTRHTPMNGPPENKSFLDALFKIRLNRILTSDEIGVRAYSTAIASISAYPYPITSTAEMQSLPGCEKKIATLWYEFTHSNPPGELAIINEIQNSEYFKTLELFYNIWGCGATTARTFWQLGYRDLDDLVKQHWSKLTRVQQIGVKFYEEFQSGIPRDEVEEIRHAIEKKARELLPGTEAALVGGYRRGKLSSGDVDLLITHPQVSKSRQVEELLVSLVDALEQDGLITHVLTIHQPSRYVATEQGVPFPKRSHHNFDGIPKVLCVWQQPDILDEEGDSQMANNESSTSKSAKKRKNTNPHRRVDILFPPPRCAGSTLTSWSGANTFERDIRRYVRHKYFWKFSSEGLTDRATAQRVPIGSETGKFIGTWDEDGVVDEDAEKRERKENGEWIGWEIEERKLFNKLELEWREPTERCTG